jgi:clan AA aspartic protease
MRAIVPLENALGTFRYAVGVANAETGPFVSLQALVDTGATYTLIPRSQVAGLGVKPRRQEKFVLADGRTVARDVAFIFVRVDDRTVPTQCILDDTAPEALLGAVTLEELGLAVDPVNRRFVPSRKYLLGVA